MFRVISFVLPSKFSVTPYGSKFVTISISNNSIKIYCMVVMIQCQICLVLGSRGLMEINVLISLTIVTCYKLLSTIMMNYFLLSLNLKFLKISTFKQKIKIVYIKLTFINSVLLLVFI